jgi:hypothetical protein
MIPSQKTILLTCGLAILLAAIPLHQIGVFGNLARDWSRQGSRFTKTS